ncbi:MAG: alpha/beta hydrolase [Clostridia bacterium]|nr:alpha/beta hydrolase [Clostridia bacterium]
MNRAELVFKAIDVLGERPQNAVRYPGIIRIQNIAYHNESEEFNVADLYFRRDIFDDGKKHPVLLYIHGGGFIKGDKDYRITNSEFFAHHGYFVFNIDYRMPPEVEIDENYADIIRALNYIDTLKKYCNLDTDKIVISGDSSGAYLSAMLCAFANDDDLRNRFQLPEIKLKPAALALMCGIFDLRKLETSPNVMGIVSKTLSMILGFEVKRDYSNTTEYEHIDYISPISFVNEKWPPVFITWADDDILCIDQGKPMAEKFDEFGIKYKSFVVDGFLNNHCYHLNLRFKLAKRCMNKCVHFLNKVLDIEDSTEDEIEEDEM